MIPVERALELYEHRLEVARLDNWPEIWAVHLAGDLILAEMFSAQVDTAKMMLTMCTPFAHSLEPDTMFVMFEAHRAPTPDPPLLTGQRALYATRLYDDRKGIRTTHWIIEYAIDDRGRREYAEPVMSPYFVPLVDQVLSGVVDIRQFGDNTHTFQSALDMVR